MPKLKKPLPKSVIVQKLLSRERGASVIEIAKATGWKDHSVRAFLAGVRKKQTLIKEERSDGVTVYRLTGADMSESASIKSPSVAIAEPVE